MVFLSSVSALLAMRTLPALWVMSSFPRVLLSSRISWLANHQCVLICQAKKDAVRTMRTSRGQSAQVVWVAISCSLVYRPLYPVVYTPVSYLRCLVYAGVCRSRVVNDPEIERKRNSDYRIWGGEYSLVVTNVCKFLWFVMMSKHWLKLSNFGHHSSSALITASSSLSYIS
jgi:hypothetical protein